MNMKTFKAYIATISTIEQGRSDAVRKFLNTIPESMKANMPDHVRAAFRTLFEQAFNAGASVASAAIMEALDDDSKGDSKTITAGSKPVKVS